MKFTVPTRRRHSRRQKEGGYAILLVLFLATLMVLATMAVAPNLKTQVQREREMELIWRGKQYVRGIKMYYRKTGKFPTSLEDLTKPKIGSLRFMRQAYKDPMNSADGEWRLIYVGPAGQIMGSLKSQRALRLTGLGGFQGIGGNAQAGIAQPPTGPAFGQPFGQQPGQGLGGFGGGLGGPGSSAVTGFGQSTQPATTATTGSVSADTSQPGSVTSSDADTDAANEALLNSEPQAVVGGNIIGVGSKINKRSIIVYDTAKNYRQFEFIWNPSLDAPVLGGSPAGQQNGLLPGAQQPGQFGQQPGQFGAPGATGPATGTVNSNTPPEAPLSPQPLPPETAPNPPPQL